MHCLARRCLRVACQCTVQVDLLSLRGSLLSFALCTLDLRLKYGLFELNQVFTFIKALLPHFRADINAKTTLIEHHLRVAVDVCAFNQETTLEVFVTDLVDFSQNSRRLHGGLRLIHRAWRSRLHFLKLHG
jgi:hypothetical protein